MFEDSDAAEVSEACMANAIEVMEWYLVEMLRLRECGYVSPEMRDAEKLRVWLLSKRAGQEITIRDLVRNGPRPASDSAVTKRFLEILENHGWIYRLREYAEVNGARAKLAWRVRKSDVP